MFRLYFLIALVNIIVSTRGNQVVETPLGVVQGHYKQSFDNRTYLAFEGIPYAKPPLGDLRFAEPQSPEKWTGILVANQSYSCWTHSPVPIPFGPAETEDCLYMYVYVPKETINGDENLDVVVHIHGGGFMLGSPELTAGPDYIMDQDVIFVSFNYRLAIFGFMSTEDNIVPGNNGLKDQTKALIWIKENIKYFGGNPDSVTLTGLSAGAASVHYHYLSPLSKGLFHRGLAQSGTAILPWSLIENPLQKAKKVASKLNCTTDSTKEMVECMRAVDAADLKEAMKVVFVYLNGVPNTMFGPALENSTNPFLPDHPYKLLKEGKVYDVPLIVSNVNDEGVFPVGILKFFHKLDEIDARWDELIPYFLDFYDTVTDEAAKIDTAKKIKLYYFNNASVNENTSRQFMEVFNDRMFLVDTEKAIRLHSKAMKSPLYYYWFSYTVKQKSFLSFNEKGVAHSDDTRLFLRLASSGLVQDPEDIKMMKFITGMITEYAKSGKPPAGNTEWKPVSPASNEINYLEINSLDNLQMKTKDKLGAIDFWSSLPIRENDKLY